MKRGGNVSEGEKDVGREEDRQWQRGEDMVEQ